MRVIVVFAACIAISMAACPRIVTREEWGARPPTDTEYMPNPVPWTVIHHGASDPCFDEESCAAMVRAYQNYHMDVHGWSDIGYSFVVGEDGNVYEGRSWGNVGAHAPGYNAQSIGICTIGTFTDHAPNDAAQNAVKQLIACGVEEGHIESDYGLIGHRQGSDTECPGNAYYSVIQTWPHYVANPDP